MSALLAEGPQCAGLCQSACLGLLSFCSSLSMLCCCVHKTFVVMCYLARVFLKLLDIEGSKGHLRPWSRPSTGCKSSFHTEISGLHIEVDFVLM
eukprot:90331-Pelagomonas_calceolata.AAC.4